MCPSANSAKKARAVRSGQLTQHHPAAPITANMLEPISKIITQRGSFIWRAVGRRKLESIRDAESKKYRCLFSAWLDRHQASGSSYRTEKRHRYFCHGITA